MTEVRVPKEPFGRLPSGPPRGVRAPMAFALPRTLDPYTGSAAVQSEGCTTGASRLHLAPARPIILIVLLYAAGAVSAAPLGSESKLHSTFSLPHRSPSLLIPNRHSFPNYVVPFPQRRDLSLAFGVLVHGLSAPPGRRRFFSSVPDGGISLSRFPASTARGPICIRLSSVLRPAAPCLAKLSGLAGQKPQVVTRSASTAGASSAVGGGPLALPPVRTARSQGAALALLLVRSISNLLRQLVGPHGVRIRTTAQGPTDTAAGAVHGSSGLGQAVQGLKDLCAGRVGSAGLWLRVCTGVPLALAAVGVVLLSPLPAFAALGWAQSLVGLGEFLALCEKKNFAVSSLAGNAAANALVLAAAATGDSEAHLLAEGTAICGHLVASLLSPPSQRGISDVAASVFGHVWCAFLPSFWIRLRALRCPVLAPSHSQVQYQRQPRQMASPSVAARVGARRQNLPLAQAAARGKTKELPEDVTSRLWRRCCAAACEGRDALMASLAAPWGPRWLVFYGFLLIALNDSVAYFMGSYFGRTGIAALFPLIRGTPLPPAALVSPRKTVVGLAAGAATGAAVGGALAATLGAAAAKQASRATSYVSPLQQGHDNSTHAAAVCPSDFARACVSAFRPAEKSGISRSKLACLLGLGAIGACMGLCVSATAVAGDLLASLLKRDAGVKDSGALLPGHGGWLDRTDAHLLAGPLLFVFGRLLQHFLSQLEAAAAEQQLLLMPGGKSPSVGPATPGARALHIRGRQGPRGNAARDTS